MNDNYYIGLDIGTDSVGWAVTDENFNVVRIKGKSAWGARIFEGANSAQQRRGLRTARRRLNRRRYRINVLLRSIFAEEIAKIDPTFFRRLEQSAYHNEDKDESIKNTLPLFINKNDEKNFYKHFPTIWHLRKALIDEKDPNHKFAYSDLRFVYLAIHHIVKYRGNFLSDVSLNSDSLKDISDNDIDELNIEFNEQIKRKVDDEIDDEIDDESEFILFPKEKKDEFIKILSNDLSISKKTKKLKESVFNSYSYSSKKINKLINEYIDLLANITIGGSKNIKNLYGLDGETKIDFTSDWENKREDIRNIMDEDFSIIDPANRIYNFVFVHNLLKGFSSISEKFVSIYDTHKKQLLDLKAVIREIDKIKNLKGKESYYYKLFLDKDNTKSEDYNYSAFVGHEYRGDYNKNDLTKFNETLKKLFNDKELLDELNNRIIYNSKNEEVNLEIIQKLISEKRYLETISSVSSSAIPHQLHEKELETILNNSKTRYPFIYKEKDKVLGIFKFRIPYYCGPLFYDKNHPNPYSSIVKVKGKEKTKIEPWTFDEIVDLEETRKNFMSKLTNTCTYLVGESVLPKGSILYEDYLILNFVNSLKINEKPLDKRIKDEIISILSNQKEITIKKLEKKLKDNLRNCGEVYKNIEITSGFTKDLKLDNSNRILFSAFGISKRVGDYPYNIDSGAPLEPYKMVEDIINTMEAFTKDGKQDAINFLKKKYKNVPNQNWNILKSYNYKGWGRLSKEFLIGLPSVNSDGVVEGHSIYNIMVDEPLELNSILNDERFNFKLLIKKRNEDILGDLTPKQKAKKIIETIPPMMRRSTIQAMRIVEEIVKLQKRAPSTIVIEVTREKNTKEQKKLKTKDSRKKQLEDYLKGLKKDIKDLKELNIDLEYINELEEKLNNRDNNELKGIHLYLYFMQLGMDMYTGNKINIEEVLDSTKYDRDHIWPQSVIKDDSLDNLVLVNRDYNQKIKKDKYPIPEEIRCNKKVLKLWKILLNKDFITKTKYDRLTRATELTDEEKMDFVNRQINLINVANITIKKVFEILYPNANLIFSKARVPSFIRQEYNIPKMRDFTDTHHAVDAYLNVVCGIKLSKYYSTIRNFVSQKELNNNNETIYAYDKVIKRIIEKDSNLKNNIMDLIKRTDFLVTFRHTYSDGGFYDQNICKAKDSSSLVPLSFDPNKPFDKTNRYGGYDNLACAYMVPATEADNEKGKETKTLIRIPILYLKLYKDNRELLEEKLTRLYCESGTNIILKNFEWNKKIENMQKIDIDGAYYIIKPMNKNQVNLIIASLFFLKVEYVKYLDYCLSRLDRIRYKIESTPDNQEINVECESISLTDNDQNIISKKKNKEIFEYLLSSTKEQKYTFYNLINTETKVFYMEEYDFDSKNIYEQLIILKQFATLFTRQYGKIYKKKFCPTTNFINRKKVSLIHESITGLISKKEEL